MAKRKSQGVSEQSALEALTNLIHAGVALDAKFPSQFSKEETDSPEYEEYYDAWQVAESLVSGPRVDES